MKIKKLLISACLLVGMSSLSFGQTNLMANWAGPNGTGAGAPNEYGWDVLDFDGSPGVSVSFQPANSGGVRYRDINSSVSPASTLEGAPWTGRLLYLRWDVYTNPGNSSKYVFSYPVELRANTQYKFSMLYQWWSNGTQPTYNVGISRDKIATDKVASADFVADEVKNVFKRGELTFTVPTNGTYYVTIGQTATTGVLGAFSDFRIVAQSTTGVRNDLNNSGYSMYPNPTSRETGLFLSERGASNEAVQLYIYSSAGKLQKQVKLAASDNSRIDISDLSAGMYIAKVVTKKGTYNKTIVVQ